MTDRSIAIVIVSYNVQDELDACLGSLMAQPHDGTRIVAVVDNASSDGTVEMIRARWPTVRVIESGGNVGFARATNIGIRATDSEFVMLLNPDTLVPDGSISALAAALAAHPEAAAAAPRLVDGAGRAELSFGWSISPVGELQQKIAGALYNRRVGPVVRWVERATRAPGEREWASGAALLVRRSDLEKVGLLDERYFMYTEDVDLCVQLRRRGRKILFVPQAEIRHLRGRSAARNPATERLRRRSQMAYYEKHHPLWLPLLRLYLALTGKTWRDEARDQERPRENGACRDEARKQEPPSEVGPYR